MINKRLESFRNPLVAIVRTAQADYLHQPPFHPSTHYPEYRGPCADEFNPAYEGVRNALKLLGLDSIYFDTPKWNPLGEIIEPGNHILIKPNLIRALIEGEKSWDCVVTHASVIRAVLDYVVIALQGKGRISIADGPESEQSFESICQCSGLYDVVDFFRHNSPVVIDLVDVRNEHWTERGGVIIQRVQAQGDPLGNVLVDLGSRSCFADVSAKKRFFGADYDIPETNLSHSGGSHKYSFSRSALAADVVINLPKMKTHKKTGVTLSLKNLVGLNTHRNYLPHYTLGFSEQGGDQYESWSLKRQIEAIILNNIKPLLIYAPLWALKLFGIFKNSGEVIFQKTSETIRSGNWYGNDTTWRMVLDLNKLFFYYDQNGSNREKTRKYLNIIDGVVAGHKNGPMFPEPFTAGIIMAGFNPIAVDTVCATLMGFDYRKIPVLAQSWQIVDYPLVAFTVDDIVCRSNNSWWSGSFADLEHNPHLNFEPHFGWKGHIER